MATPRATPAPAAAATRSVHWWALLGGAVVALQLYIYGSWLLSGDAKPVPVGPDRLPDRMAVSVVVMQVLGCAAGLGMVWGLLVRPWRRDGRPSFDGLLCVGLLSMYWQDPIPNYAQWQFSYNAHFVNLGSWAPDIPGFSAPNGHKWAEPFLFNLPLYIFFIVPGVIVGTWVMRFAHRRRPRWGAVRLVFCAWLTIAVLDAVVEPFFLWFGAWSYDYGAPGWTFWSGHHYQYPLYEGITVGATLSGMSALRYFTDDRGESLVERGASQSAVSAPRQTVLRLLAVVGACNVLWFGFTNGPYLLVGLHAKFNRDSTSRSYFTQGVCGGSTTIACPSAALPINKRGSVHIAADGSLRSPSGERVSARP